VREPAERLNHPAAVSDALAREPRAAGADRAGGADKPRRPPAVKNHFEHAVTVGPARPGRDASRGTTMSTPTSAPANGRARKSLEHHLARRDAILDGLAAALDGAVAGAAGEAVGRAVREAVQAVVAELLTTPDVARKLAEAHRLITPPEPPVAPAGPTW